MSLFQASDSTEKRPETPEEEYDCLNETGGRIGPEGGRLEVLPGTWVIIDKDTFSYPSYVKVQVRYKDISKQNFVNLCYISFVIRLCQKHLKTYSCSKMSLNSDKKNKKQTTYFM